YTTLFRSLGAHASFGGSEHLRGRRLDHRALEEVGIELAPEAHGITEHEVPEVFTVEQAMLDQLVGLGDNVRHVRYVEMPDVRAEDRVEPRAHGVRAAVEGPSVDGVVGLAAEVEPRDEQVVEVLLLLDLAAEI